uniref:Uncharacterized protein n=1 Tax=Marseillevirus LCMAC101 TaxID=2506602 RepID=A0A481YSX0_9VIRU|nr:MAG: hypothetical protein LCMAC101_06520 [Marseillevirus LCMAC101]
MDEKPAVIEEIREVFNSEETESKEIGDSQISKTVKEIVDSRERILDSQEKTRDSLEETQKTVEHINEMLDGLIGINERREYRRKYGEIAYGKSDYFGDTYY